MDVDAILTVVCQLSNYIVAIPVNKRGLTAQQVGWTMYRDVFCRFGVPSEIRSDNDVLFEAAWWKAAMQHMGVKHYRCTSYRPQGNGAAERANGKLIAALKSSLLARGRPTDN